MQLLLVVDMQNDFIDGALGTPEAVAIVPRVAEYIAAFDGAVWYTRDTHQPDYLQTQEGENLPVEHCIAGTHGWQISTALPVAADACIIDKPTFGSLALAEQLLALQAEQPLDGITLVGLCTDICVISNALLVKAALPEVPVQVVADCCAGVTPQSHANALEAMKMCQIKIV